MSNVTVVASGLDTINVDVVRGPNVLESVVLAPGEDAVLTVGGNQKLSVAGPSSCAPEVDETVDADEAPVQGDLFDAIPDPDAVGEVRDGGEADL